jgi:hypothetical protein
MKRLSAAADQRYRSQKSVFTGSQCMSPQLIFGLGAGHCGLGLLADLLNQQPGVRMTLEQRPLLPWRPRPQGPGIRERIERWLRHPPAACCGDVASFYLPYVEAALEAAPTAKFVCLQRPREEITAAFCRHLDERAPVPTNHWSERPAAGWQHDPLWSQTFPQYATKDRQEGLRLYWDEYYSRAELLQNRFPSAFRIFDTDILTTTAGVAWFWVGAMPSRRQPGRHASDEPTMLTRRGRTGEIGNAPTRCVLLDPPVSYFPEQ